MLVAVRYAGQDGTDFYLDLHNGRPLAQSDYNDDSNKHIIGEIVRQVGYLPECFGLY